MLYLTLRQEFRGVNMPSTDIALHMFVQHGALRIITGQRKWKVSGSSKVTHGGLSLLEVASPWIEIASL